MFQSKSPLPNAKNAKNSKIEATFDAELLSFVIKEFVQFLFRFPMYCVNFASSLNLQELVL